MKNIKIVSLLSLFCLLSACSERDILAPVEELKWHAFNPHAKQYVVVKGDTLYAVAFRYDLDYRQMAAYNHLRSPYTLRIGQVLQLSTGRPSSPPSSQSSLRRPTRFHDAKPVPRPIKRATHDIIPQGAPSNSNWQWPAHGKVVAHFAPQRGIKGINISGQKGDKIVAASSGVVAYSGNGLAGYGNLIIIRHNGEFLTAYGNNLRNVVREGQSVRKGQVIADMGVMDRHYWGVHFEIRKSGKPIDPLGYLK